MYIRRKISFLKKNTVHFGEINEYDKKNGETYFFA